tara:strand:- start:254 stop:520 length:267 start_codon:yes stop_codon:yes gene_type:complete|eukprot:scaffold18016_cov65-Phaeocystis_antarctica.AAC.6
MSQRAQRQLSTPPVDTVDPSDVDKGLWTQPLTNEERGLEGADADEDEDEELMRCLPSKGSHHAGYSGGVLDNIWMRNALADGRFIVPC